MFQPYHYWFFKHIIKRKNIFLLMVITLIIHMSIRLVVPFALGNIIDDISNGNFALIPYYALAILLSGLIAESMDLVMSSANEVLAQTVEMNARIEFFDSMLQKRMAFHDTAKIGNLMALATNDIRMMNLTVSPGLHLLGEPVVAITGVIVLMYVIHPLACLLLILMFPVFFVSIFLFHIFSRNPSILQQLQFRSMNAYLEESIQGIRVIKGFRGEPRTILNYKDKNKAVADTKVKRGIILGGFYPSLILTAITGIMFIFGVYLAFHNAISLASLIALNSLMFYLRGPTLLINNTLQNVQLGLAGAQGIYNLLTEDIYGEETTFGKELSIKGKIEFQNVSFEYIPGKPVLKNINFVVQPGETIAILGPTGSGKSTLLKLLTRFYDPSPGSQILIDDVPINDISLQSLRSQIAVVEQDIFLFSTTIRDNISYSLDNVSDDEIIQAAKLAQAHDFISKMPGQYMTIVGERGVTLSGGQKQRVAIARAFLANPRILILDDSTSALDAKTENEVALAIDKLQKGRTTFIITHRFATIRRASRILLLSSDGQIESIGTHHELLNYSQAYRKIFHLTV